MWLKNILMIDENLSKIRQRRIISLEHHFFNYGVLLLEKISRLCKKLLLA